MKSLSKKNERISMNEQLKELKGLEMSSWERVALTAQLAAPLACWTRTFNLFPTLIMMTVSNNLRVKQQKRISLQYRQSNHEQVYQTKASVVPSNIANTVGPLWPGFSNNHQRETKSILTYSSHLLPSPSPCLHFRLQFILTSSYTYIMLHEQCENNT